MNMRPHRLLSLALILFLAIPKDTAQAESRRYTIFGRTECSDWLKTAVRKSDPAAPIDLTWIPRSTSQQWLAGYLSALNGVEPISGKDLLANMDLDTASVWMDRYCTQNPTKDIIDGSKILIKELKKISK